MASPEFAAGLARLQEIGSSNSVAVMCAEADWTQCHRRLISDALVSGGGRVLHLGPDGSLVEHELNEAAVIDGESITYPAIQTSLDV